MSRSLSDISTEELIERCRFHENTIKIINNELSNRNVVTKKANITVKRIPTIQKNDKKNIKRDGKKGITRNNMMVILDRKDIKYKKNSTKAELLDIIRKNNLVRIVEEYSSNKE